MEQKQKYSAMVNPIDTSFRKHIKAVLTDLVKAYSELDGIILDRVRYDGIEADFSDLSRSAFEQWQGKKIKNWPTDIFTWKKGNDKKWHVERGPLFNKWIEWRSQVIHDAMADLRSTVKAARPDISFGTYTGAWYPSYYEVGVNFASNTYDPSADYDWATPTYKRTGYMELLDLYTTGNYYTDITITEAERNTKGVKNETDSETQRGMVQRGGLMQAPAHHPRRTCRLRRSARRPALWRTDKVGQGHRDEHQAQRRTHGLRHLPPHRPPRAMERGGEGHAQRRHDETMKTF